MQSAEDEGVQQYVESSAMQQTRRPPQYHKTERVSFS